MRSIRAVALTLTLAAGCESPEEHVLTFGQVSHQCLTWDRFAVLCEDVIADDGEFNTLQWIEGLPPTIGETVTVRYMQYPQDTGSSTDLPEHTFELIEVESRARDPIGTQYAIEARHLLPRPGDPEATLFMPDDRAFDELDQNVGVVFGCADEALCAPISVDVDPVARLTVELTDDPIVPLQIVARE